MSLTADDLRRFQHKHPGYRLDLIEGKIRVMSPSEFETVPELLSGWELEVSSI
jgi:hypothetical protein